MSYEADLDLAHATAVDMYAMGGEFLVRFIAPHYLSITDRPKASTPPRLVAMHAALEAILLDPGSFEDLSQEYVEARGGNY